MENLKVRRAAVVMMWGYRQFAPLENCEGCKGGGCSLCGDTGKSDFLDKIYADILQDMTRAVFPELFDSHFSRDTKGFLLHKSCLCEVRETRTGTFCKGHGDMHGRMMGTSDKPGWNVILKHHEHHLFPNSS